MAGVEAFQRVLEARGRKQKEVLVGSWFSSSKDPEVSFGISGSGRRGKSPIHFKSKHSSFWASKYCCWIRFN